MRARYKFSQCVCYQVPDRAKAVEFYHNVLGLTVVRETTDNVELDADPIRLFVDQGPSLGPIMEIVVDNLETARVELLSLGCTEIRWDGLGRPCYLRDPFGICFNVWEDPKVFGPAEGERK
jgi:catechol 2,3-dioxygenase-like lactoylglutathione lyase family enzyme